jgi:eukaryotic-like serine/threonine-protein kinase
VVGLCTCLVPNRIGLGRAYTFWRWFAHEEIDVSSDRPSASPPEREAELFEQALDKTGAEREAFLEHLAKTDPALHARLKALLAAYDQPDGPLAELPDPVRPADGGTSDAQTDEAVGQTIGRYKLLQQIGEGGCGIVYVAEQTEPIRRRVALKVIKLGMDTKQVIARFEAERQALALMDHPNIAKVLDAGTIGAPDSQLSTLNSQLPLGRPYFVMELVRGVKITDFCDENRLTTQERLDLFVQICHAIQHAHQKGIIHRDIKPSNILVTVNDGVPVPKVIDFGVAKAIGQQLTDKTVYTAFEQFIGTPAYMSPEQAVMTSLDIDTRSDIYSLGVLLYELLTGHTPFDQKELIAAGLDEMRRIIRETEPVRPSTCLRTLAGPEQTTIAQRHHTEPPQLVHLVRGDLDWIVMKCLEKDRARRYATANGLAQDVMRHLRDEVVAARPPSKLYRLRKSVSRNRLAYCAAMTVVISLALGITFSWLEAARARKAEKLGGQRLLQSEKAREEAEAISRFLTEVFQSPDPARDGRTITVAETLDKAARKLENELPTQPARRAQLQSTLGSTYAALGLFREAILLNEKVRDCCVATFGPKDPDTVIAMHNLGDIYVEGGRRSEALKLNEQVLTLSRKVLGPKHRANASKCQVV